MDVKYRCDCPITSALDILGDKWILVILKQMLVEHKSTFKDFTESDEAIATNILSAKLKLLEEQNLITKTKLPNNKKTNIYGLTDKGLALAPVIVELALWADTYLRDGHPNMMDDAMAMIKADKSAFVERLVTEYQRK